MAGQRGGSWGVYVVLFAVFVGSACLTWLLQASGVLQQLAAVPAAGALVLALYQVVRDEAQHLRKLALQHDRQRFELGATSHMANVAFDKHVEFCEEYVAMLHETLTILWREGESTSALIQADKLLDVQRKYAVWVTPEIASQLNEFDLALRRIGSTAWLQKRDPAAAHAGGRVEEMMELFADVVGLDKEPGKQPNREIAITTIIERARAVLGVRQLVELRNRLLALRSEDPLG